VHGHGTAMSDTIIILGPCHFLIPKLHKFPEKLRFSYENFVVVFFFNCTRVIHILGPGLLSFSSIFPSKLLKFSEMLFCSYENFVVVFIYCTNAIHK
jgi:hypothetical protein